MAHNDTPSGAEQPPQGDPAGMPPADSGAGRRKDGSSPTPPWQPPQPPLHEDLAAAGAPAQPPYGAGIPPHGGAAPGHSPAGYGSEPAPAVDPFALEAEATERRNTKRKRRRTVVITLGVTALLAGTITAVVASQNDDDDYAQVCTDESTQQRVEDSKCEDSGASSTAGRSHTHYGWYFFPRGSSIPAIGSSVKNYSGGTSTLPKGSTAAKGFSSKGGSFTKSTTSRGGFGKSSGGRSTGG